MGFVYADDVAQAAYFVEWNPQHEGEGTFDLITGKWGEHTLPSHRFGVSLMYRNHPEDGPSFMVGDATKRRIATNPLVGSVMTRDEVLGTPLATEVFALIDAICLGDPRLPFISD